MADITDIKTIMYTEKSLNQQESGIIVMQTSQRVSKNQLKNICIKYFGFTPIRINSLNQQGKSKRFRGVEGSRSSFKKFYVKVHEGAKIESLRS